MFRRFIGAAAASVAASFALCGTAQAACDEVDLAGYTAAAVATPSAPDAWGGPRSGGEPTLSDRVVGYRIDAELDTTRHTVTGHERLTWRNRSRQAICSVYLHQYPNALQNSGSTFLTERLARHSGGPLPADGEWGYQRLDRVEVGGEKVRVSHVQPDGGPATDQTVARLDLPHPVGPGESISIDIDFFDQLPRTIERSGWFGSFHFVAQWFPKIGVLELPGERGAVRPRWNVHEFHELSEFYADFGEYDVHVTVPAGTKVAAVGEEVGAPVESAGKVTHHFVQGDVHDFAFLADARYAEPIESTWHGAGSPEVKLRVFFPPEYRSNAEPAMQAARDSLDYFSKTLGPYPYRTVTVVVPPFNTDGAGGMEYPTLFTVDHTADITPGTIGRSLADFTVVHEFGHGYFYGIVASNEFEEPMLDEGLNNFWDDRMLDALHRPLQVAPPWLRTLGIDPSLSWIEGSRPQSELERPADALGANSWNRLSHGSYYGVYSVTPLLLHDLEARVGQPAFERAMKLYYDRWKFRHPGIADLQEALIDGTGDRAAVEQAFAQQVYAASKVDDRIDGFSSREVLPEQGYELGADGKRTERTEDQVDQQIAQQRKAHPDAAFPFLTTVTVRREGADVAQTLVVKFADGSVETEQWSGPEHWHRFNWTKQSRALSAEIDPDRRVLLDRDKLDDSRTLATDGSATRRWLADIASLFQAVLALVVSL